MAGFFGFFDYNKPGPGVPKDGPPKARILVFFEILQRKFWNLIKVNLMFNLFNIPAVIIGMMASIYLFQQIIPGTNLNNPDAAMGDIISRFVLLTAFMCIPAITVGPAQAGFTYVLRNYAREEHAFIWSDFKEHAFKNLKQSLIVSVIDFFAVCFMLLALKFYFLMNSNNSLLITVATTIMVMVFVIFMIMHIYIYPMMVTFKLSTKQLYKNALLFSVAKLIPNIGILLLCILILFLTFGIIIPFSPIIGFILYAFITVSFIGLITNFYAYGKIQRYMMPAVEDEDEDEDEDEEEEYEEDSEEGNEEVDEEEYQEVKELDSATDEDSSEEPVVSKNEPENTDEIKRYY